MKINKKYTIGLFLCTALSMAFTLPSQAAAKKAAATEAKAGNPSAQLEYKLGLAEDGKTYQLWMKPLSTPKPDMSLTGQVTLKVPHDASFQVANLKSNIEGVTWVEASRVDAPKEDAQADYISFSFVGLQGASSRNYGWEKDKEQVIFSFENKTGCVSGAAVMANDDAFNAMPNSANTNPGNQFTNLGWGSVNENHYKGNYGEAIKCPK
jgi:hypothetical protein